MPPAPPPPATKTVEEDDFDAKVLKLAGFLRKFYYDDLRDILLDADPSKVHSPLVIEFAELMDFDPGFANYLYSNPRVSLDILDTASKRAQSDMIKQSVDLEHEAQQKKSVHVRIDVSGSPLEFPETSPSIGKVRVKHMMKLITLKGTVIRSGGVKMIEYERYYMCSKCKYRFLCCPELEAGIRINLPASCPSTSSRGCVSSSFQVIEGTIVCHDYQEIKIQENVQLLGVGSIPRSMPVILMDDLVDIIKAGDDVIVTGILSAKWSPDNKDVRSNLDPMLIANYVRITNELKSDIDIPHETVEDFEHFWKEHEDTPLKGRNLILRGICPQIFGLFTVKLAVALTLIGGVQHVDASGTKVRGEPHMLLVGDPGTGKSQFLKFAAKLSNRSVITTGLGSTSAGLTVTAVKDAGLSVNTTLSGPLLSRFDIVLVLLDTKNSEWDEIVSSHILNENFDKKDKTNVSEAEWTLPQLRRYINYVKKQFKPVLTKEAEIVISSYYHLQRKSGTHNAARTTVRMLESLIRLAQAHARLMFRKEVIQLDAIAAILCIESSTTTSPIVDTIGNALHSNFTDNPDEICILECDFLACLLKNIKDLSHVTSKLSSLCRPPFVLLCVLV